MKVENEKTKRLDEAVKYLISMGLIDEKAPIKDISQKMGRHRNNVSAALGGDEKYFTRKFTLGFCATYGNIISVSWIWDGKGNMLEDVDYRPVMKALPSDFIEENEDRERENGMPYFDVDFLGGFDEMYNDQPAVPAYYIDIQPYNKNGNVWCNITGDSMSPRINSGDKICIQQVNSINDIIYGEIYAIVTYGNMRTVKWVVRSPEKGMIRLVPENKDQRFGDYQDLKIEDICKIFKVVGSIRTF